MRARYCRIHLTGKRRKSLFQTFSLGSAEVQSRPAAGRRRVAEALLRYAEAMNVELSEEDLPLVRRALEHYYAYTCAVQREDGRI